MQGGLDSAQRGLHHCGDGSQERPSTARTRVPWEAAPPPVPLERRSPVRRQTHLHLGCPLGRVPPQYGIDSSCCLFSRLMLAYGRVLVAHSWGGTVISEAGMDPKVTALVYVAARAPDAGEDFVALSGKFPTMPVRAGIQELHQSVRGSFSQIFRERCRARQSKSPLCRTTTRRRLSVRRANHSGCLALQTELVCGVETRSDDIA